MFAITGDGEINSNNKQISFLKESSESFIVLTFKIRLKKAI